MNVGLLSSYIKGYSKWFQLPSEPLENTEDRAPTVRSVVSGSPRVSDDSSVLTTGLERVSRLLDEGGSLLGEGVGHESTHGSL